MPHSPFVPIRDPVVARYGAIARRAHALVDHAAPASVAVPAEVIRLVSDCVYRLGLYVSAMPGARAASPRDVQRLVDTVDDPTADQAAAGAS